jgi:lantibiotic modifying enzyme
MTALVEDDLRSRARAAAYELGERLLRRAHAAQGDDEFVPMRGLCGSPGYALAFAALAQLTKERRFESAAHEFMRASAQAGDFPRPGLFDGVSGLRAAASLMTGIEPRYARLVAQCDAFIDANLPRIDGAARSFADFDLISGLTGIRLARCTEGAREPDETIDRLAFILSDRARWCCVHPVRGGPPENDLGLAHGLAGMLAALALTLERFDGVRDLVIARARELAACSSIAGGARVWPYVAQDPSPERFRCAWCYGTPGVAYALYAVGCTGDDSQLQKSSLDALRSVAVQPTHAWDIVEAGICHGRLGNALIFASAGRSAGCSVLRAAADRLLSESLERLAADGWECLAVGEDGALHPASNELVGSAGAILALLTLTGDCAPSWMIVHGVEPL